MQGWVRENMKQCRDEIADEDGWMAGSPDGRASIWTDGPIDEYSEIPLLRPPKIGTSYLLKTLFAKFKLFFSSFSTHSVLLIRDHLWDCPKVVFKTTFGQSQRWS